MATNKTRPELNDDKKAFIAYRLGTYKNEEDSSLRMKQEQQALETVFQSVVAAEDKLHKDVAEFTKPEILELYKNIGKLSYHTLSNRNRRIGQYATWYHGIHPVDGWENPYADVTADEIRQIADVHLNKGKLITRDDLIKALDANERRLASADCFLVLAAFEGIKGPAFIEISNLTINDFKVDEAAGTYVVFVESGAGSKKQKQVSAKLYSYAKDAAAKEIYEYEGEFFRLESAGPYKDYIIKPFFGKEWKSIHTKTISQRYQVRIKRAMEMLGYAGVGAQKLRDWGKIEFIKKRAAQHNFTVERYIKEDISTREVRAQYGEVHISRFYFVNKHYFD